MKHNTKLKDEEGYLAFALVKKVTGEAIKHSVGATQPINVCSIRWYMTLMLLTLTDLHNDKKEA
ncbi:hypothetical protein IHE45_10G033500 [Dioscorea alata]|uniref:Uncharacterized protein n=4 Tax=Dioscorea alata TaxID=55571 RepID=A0ACB7VA81_DIOAL|nr:hypothetical protein IHE45_10G033500 [Dioscorea alata]KAH7670536.1 hypothetical protein IHE45_10G033500 [Dioscorea alata]KAH7670537.1 hypothetical protein IHE45_10G033500 [Dioscorea alata]KAH7670538.1 hypothetical protein IHE45_10G033500 [Dioscorea alata]